MGLKMPTSIDRIRELTKSMNPPESEGSDERKENEDFAEKWLGYFEEAAPSSKTSTELVRELRSTSYGKIKK